MTGYYTASFAGRPSFPALTERIAVHTAVIGGGFAGLYTALGLAERGQQAVCLLEAERIGFGASGRNGGFVFAGYSLGESDLLRRVPPATAVRLYQRTVAAVDRIRSRIAQYDIDCDLVDAGVLWVNWFRDARVLKSRQQLLARHYGSEWEWVDRERLRHSLDTDRYSAALFERNAMHVHPLKLAAGLAQAVAAHGVRVHEGTRVRAVLPQADGRFRLPLAHGAEVLAEHVVISCGGYLERLEPRLARALLPIATYVVSTPPDPRVREAIDTAAAIYDTRFAFDYYRRTLDQRLLWGGRISTRDATPTAVSRLLRADISRVYPQLGQLSIEHAWSGLMSYARHQMPQLGQLQPGLWYAQAFGGHGLAPTLVAGELLAAAIAHQDQGWRDFASFGLPRTFGPLGRVAAQLSYAWAQLRDHLRR